MTDIDGIWAAQSGREGQRGKVSSCCQAAKMDLDIGSLRRYK
jgi:hypothetical protein